MYYRDPEPPAARDTGGEVHVMRHRQVWGAMLMRMLGGPVIHFYWYWLPEYLKRERQFSMEMIGMYAGIPFLFAGLGNIAGGWFSGRLMRSGWSADRARKTSFILGASLCGVSLLVPFVPGERAAIALICAATFGLSAFVATHIGMLTDLFPQRVLAQIAGITGAGEGVMNIVLTLATGIIVDRLSYVPVFAAAGLMPALAVIAMFVLIRRIEPVRI
jgi:ACS family hexuronate transporter-like MFS transporter